MSWSDGTTDPLPAGHPERGGRPATAITRSVLGSWALVLTVNLAARGAQISRATGNRPA